MVKNRVSGDFYPIFTQKFHYRTIATTYIATTYFATTYFATTYIATTYIATTYFATTYFATTYTAEHFGKVGSLTYRFQ